MSTAAPRFSWIKTTLGAVAEVDMGQSPPGDTYNTEGLGMPFMQGSAEFGEHSPSPVKFCSAPLKVAEIGDLLLSVRAPVGDSNIADQRIAIGRGLAAIRGTEHAITTFLRLLIQSNTQQLLATSGTGMFSSITGKNLRELSLELPPLLEQRRIVDVMASVDAYTTALEQQADDARAARNAVLHELLTAGGDVWTETTLGAVAEVEMGQSPPGHTYNTGGLGLPFMQGSAEFGERSPRPVKFCSAPLKVAEIGDLLLSVRAPVGDSNIADQRIAIGRGLAVIRGNGQTITTFLRLLIQANTLRLLAVSGTGMFSSITSKNLREFSLALPPIAEQKRFVEIVTAMDDFISTTEQAIARAELLRSGLLSDLFSGEHEIPDSYDRLLGAA